MPDTASTTSTSINEYLDGSVSHGTLRSVDLFDAFYSTWKGITGLEDAGLEATREAHDADGGDADALYDALNDLMDRLDALAPEGYYFGAHYGDGSDFGFWLSDPF